MYISRTCLVAVLAYGSSVAAAPAQGNCNPVDAIYGILKGPLKAQASSFCLGWLGGDKTVTGTQTVRVTGAGSTVVVTAPDQTQQATAQVTNVNQVTVTQQVTNPPPTQTVVVVVTAATRTIYQKKRDGDAQERRENRPQCPPALVIFGEQKVSSACSCIVTPTTKTVFNTAVKTVAGPQATSNVPGRTVVVTVRQTIQVTSEVDVTQTVQGTATPVQTVQTTVTPILVKPKICNAKGLPGANAFNYNANFNTNQADCIASCKTDGRCLSTGFYLVTDPSTGATTGTCRFYDKSVTDSADLGFGYYNFNDKAC